MKWIHALYSFVVQVYTEIHKLKMTTIPTHRGGPLTVYLINYENLRLYHKYLWSQVTVGMKEPEKNGSK